MLDFNVTDFYAELETICAGGNPAAVEAYLKKTLAYVESTMTTSSCSTCACHDDKALEQSEDRQEALEWVITRSKGIIAVVSELGSLYRDTGRLDEAADCFTRARAELEEAGLRKEGSYAMTLLNLGVVRRLLGDPAAALQLLKEALAVLTESGGTDEAFANLYNNLGLAAREDGDSAAAEAYFEKALTAAEKDGDPEAAAAILDNLSLTLRVKGDGTAAEAAIDRALALLDGAPVPQLAACLNSKAVLRYEAGDAQAAFRFFEQAAERTKALFGPGPQYAATCRNCAAVARRLGNTEAAERYAALGNV